MFWERMTKSLVWWNILSFICLIRHVDSEVPSWLSTYQKPTKSAKECFISIENMEQTIEEETIFSTNSTIVSVPFKHQKLCMGCIETTQADCPHTERLKCQPLIDDLFDKCEGVTLPPNYFFNPPVSSTIRNSVFI